MRMRKFFLAVVSAVFMVGGLLAPTAPSVAQGYYYHHERRDYRRDYRRHHRRHRICRTFYERRVIWRHHRRHVIRVPVRRCYWTYRRYRRY